MISPMRYVSILTPARSISASTRVSGSSTLAVERASRRAPRAARAAGRRAGAAPRRRERARPSPPRPPASAQLDAVLGGEVGRARTSSAPGSIRYAASSVSSARVDARAPSRRGRRARPRRAPAAAPTTTPLGVGDGGPVAVGRDSRRGPEQTTQPFAPRHLDAGHERIGAAGQRVVELVDPREQVRGTRSGGRSPSARERSGGASTSCVTGRSRCRGRGASSRAPSTTRAWSACSVMFFARAGESSSACSITASSEPYCAISCPAVLSPMPGNARDVVATCRP